jgi:hypothetical protein
VLSIYSQGGSEQEGIPWCDVEQNHGCVWETGMDGCMVVLGGRRVKGGEAWRWWQKLADMLEWGECVGSPFCLGNVDGVFWCTKHVH